MAVASDFDYYYDCRYEYWIIVWHQNISKTKDYRCAIYKFRICFYEHAAAVTQPHFDFIRFSKFVQIGFVHCFNLTLFCDEIDCIHAANSQRADEARTFAPFFFYALNYPHLPVCNFIMIIMKCCKLNAPSLSEYCAATHYTFTPKIIIVTSVEKINSHNWNDSFKLIR